MPCSVTAPRFRENTTLRAVFRLAQSCLLICLLSSTTLLHASLQEAQDSSRPLLITSAGALHDLPPDQARKARVHLVGTVTYYDRFDQVMFLQDDTGSVYINGDKSYPVTRGQLISVDGIAAPSFRTEVAPGAVIHVLGPGKPIRPLPATWEDLVTSNYDTRLVTVQGIVRDAVVEQHKFAPALHMDLGLPSGELGIYVADFPHVDTVSLLGSTVEVTGAAGGAFDAKNQLTGLELYVQNLSSIRVLKPSPVSIFKLPTTDFNDVFPQLRYHSDSPRLHVRGTVTYYRKGDSIVLQDGEKSLPMRTRQTDDIAIGDVVDAYGFPSNIQYAPSMRQALVFKTGQRQVVEPTPINYETALSGRYSDNLISLTGRLVSELQNGNSSTIVIDVNGHLISALLEESKDKLPQFAVGSLMRVSGICRINFGGPWRMPMFFRLDMRSPADVVVVARPYWWTVRHLIELLTALLLIVSVIATWALLLHRRVKQQSGRIASSMQLARKRSEILEQISHNDPTDLLLSSLCAAVQELAPGLNCCYALHDTPSVNAIAPETQSDEDYTVPLRSSDNQLLGAIHVTGPAEQLARHEEVLAMLNELATLAMRQSLLHKGLIHHSTHDPLTDLPNRRLCETRLYEAMQVASQTGDPLAVIYIDINRFKAVNDQYGHKTGDLYLQAISQRLNAQLRPTDTLARIGGDEFMVVVPDTRQSEAASLMARLAHCFSNPFMLEDQRVHGSASFGLACYPEHGTTHDDLERHADRAMYLDKSRRQELLLQQKNQGNIALLAPAELEAALEKGHFRLAYQPQFTPEGTLSGMEVLLRLQDPILGPLMPDAFIQVAENSSVILPIGRWVLRQALKDAVSWGLHTGPHVLIAVNVAARQIEQPGFAAMVLDCLHEAGFPPDRLELELTERVLIVKSAEVLGHLQTLHEAGVRIGLDDFGTGHSSLSLVHNLPIDTIKLDRSFILAMEAGSRVLSVIHAIAFMAQRLGMRIVAEGVEEAEDVVTLLRLSRMDFQGYLLSRPVNSEHMAAALPGWLRGIPVPGTHHEEHTPVIPEISA